jgi:hypothetical protein
MPKAEMKEPFATLARDVIATLLAGHHRYRAELAYPESHSDMLGAVMGLFEMFEVKRRDLPFRIPMERDEREELGRNGLARVLVHVGESITYDMTAKGVKVNDKHPDRTVITVPRGSR